MVLCPWLCARRQCLKLLNTSDTFNVSVESKHESQRCPELRGFFLYLSCTEREREREREREGGEGRLEEEEKEEERGTGLLDVSVSASEKKNTPTPTLHLSVPLLCRLRQELTPVAGASAAVRWRFSTGPYGFSLTAVSAGERSAPQSCQVKCSARTFADFLDMWK